MESSLTEINKEGTDLKRFKNNANEYRELNICHKFYPFIQIWIRMTSKY